MATLPYSTPRAAPRPAFDHITLERAFVVLTLIGIVAARLIDAFATAELILAVNIATYFFGGFYAVRAIIGAIKEWQIEVDLLMVLAALGAAYVDAWEEGAILLFLFALSNVLQHYALGRTTRAIAALMELRPDTVTIRRDGALVDLPLDSVRVGEVMVLRPGERVALDGEIIRGSGNFDESTLTGEALPVHKSVGAPVLAGTLNQTGALDVRITKRATESTLARIIEMVSAAQERKARTQSVLDRFEQWYAIGVIVSVALFILLVPPITGAPFDANFYTAMVLLTVASPCALVIGVPSAVLSAIATAARRGVLFKGGAHLEELARIRAIAFDKTGTLTYGKPKITDIEPQPGVSEEELLQVLLRAEMLSEHPLARAVTAYAATHGVVADEPEQFEAIVGRGVRAAWDGAETLVGSPHLFADRGITVPPDILAEIDRLAASGRQSLLIVYRAGAWLGLVSVMDQERPDAAEKIAALRRAGINTIVMLTGDEPRIAEAIGKRLGIDEIHAGLMPEDKLRLVEELGRRHGPIAMVGDGVNDAPALAAATVGVAMGGAGTDAALESADVVLMSDDLGALAYAVDLSRRSQRIVWQNIAFALVVVVVLVTLTLTVGVALPLGVVGHEGSTILVVLNGLRLLSLRSG
jgi:Cd2+/Zn2+-exporting ATPase